MPQAAEKADGHRPGKADWPGRRAALTCGGRQKDREIAARKFNRGGGGGGDGRFIVDFLC